MNRASGKPPGAAGWCRRYRLAILAVALIAVRTEAQSDPGERNTVPPSQWYAAPAAVPPADAAPDVALPVAVPQVPRRAG